MAYNRALFSTPSSFIYIIMPMMNAVAILECELAVHIYYYPEQYTFYHKMLWMLSPSTKTKIIAAVIGAPSEHSTDDQ